MKCHNTAILWWKLHLACGLPVRLRERSLATFIHSLAKVLLLFNVYWVFTVCKVSIFQTFYFYSPSRPSCPLHQSPTLQFISFLASQQILKPVRQGMLKVGSGSGGNCHIPILELTTRRHHHKAALWSHAAWVATTPLALSCDLPGGPGPSAWTHRDRARVLYRPWVEQEPELWVPPPPRQRAEGTVHFPPTLS